MFASNMDIIDLCSDGEDSIDLCSDREDGLDFDDTSDGFDQLLVSLNTTFGQNNAEHPIWLEDDDWLNGTKASSSYRPAENRYATEMSSEFSNFLAPMNIGLNMQNSNGQYRTLPLSLTSSRNSSHPFSLTGGNNIESVCHIAPVVSVGGIYPLPSSSLGMPHDSSHAIPYDQNIDSAGAVYASNDNNSTLPSSLTNGTTAKFKHLDAANGACHFPQSFTNGSSRSFGENWTKEELIVKSNNVQKSVNGIGIPSFTIATDQKPYVNNSQCVLTENDDDDVSVYRFLPQSFPSSHSSLGDNWIKEESTAKSNGFQGSSANGIGIPSSTMSTDWKPPINSSQKVKTDNVDGVYLISPKYSDMSNHAKRFILVQTVMALFFWAAANGFWLRRMAFVCFLRGQRMAETAADGAHGFGLSKPFGEFALRSRPICFDFRRSQKPKAQKNMTN